MRSFACIAAAALVSTTLAVPAMARDYCDYHRCYHRGPVGAAVDTAAGVAGAAIGTAGAIATAPFRNSYAYDRDDYNRRVYERDMGPGGFACQPGTWFRAEDGRRHLCQ
jgi:hypothetical protein